MVWVVNAVANSVLVGGCYRLASQDLNHVVLGLLGACRLYHQDIATALEGAQVVVNRAGVVHFDGSRELSWIAKNQVTSTTQQMRLPLMKVGDIPIQQVADFAHEAPLVDEVQSLYKTSATVFQRMNETGDMLRVATTVKKADGGRAIGTYIPAHGADGKPNPVITTVLSGKTYLGRAFVVNSWYMAAYQPLKDGKGAVVGMIYAGLPEAQLRDKLAQFKDYGSTSGKVDMFVIHTAAKAQGLFVFSRDKSLQDHVAWNDRDGKGELYVQQICNAALKADEGQISESTYWTLPAAGKASEKMLVRFVYFPAWDWVIGIQEPERDFLAMPALIGKIFLISNYAPLVLALIAMVVALRTWKRLTGQLAQQVQQVLTALEGSSKQFIQSIQLIGKHSASVGSSAEKLSAATHVQASSAEQTSATTSAVTETARQNSKAAENMRALSSQSETMIRETRTILGEVDGAMQSMLGTNDQALSIIDTINDISFATNIVALNASVEAAKAGEAGRTFAFIADEVRALAAKVATAALETRTIIHNAREEMNSGSAQVRRLVAALNPMNQNADQIRRMAVDVSTVSLQQAESMAEVLKAVEQIQKASSHSAQAAQQSSSDATNLRSEVTSLATSVRIVDQAIGTLKEEVFGV